VKDLEELESKVLHTASAQSDEIWGRHYTVSDLKRNMTPLIYVSPKGYGSLFRCKINRTGPAGCVLWDHARERTTWPEKWRGMIITPMLVAKCIWVMGQNWGITVEMKEALLRDSRVQKLTCPF
jgi:hypothetical protein